MTDVTISSEYVKQFRDAFALGVDNIVRASQIYVEAIDANPKNVEVFQDEFADSIPATAWSNFEAVGRKWMHPRLLLGGGGRYANQIKRLPYSTQDRIFSGDTFELLSAGGDKLNVDVRNITPEQADQLFNKGSIRSLREQKAWLESHKVHTGETEEPDAKVPYVIRGTKVHFRANATLTRDEVKRLALEMM